MFENIMNFFKRIGKKEKIEASSKDTAKERLHLVLMQDRANVSADFLDMMRQEIIEVIKKYIDVDENDIDVRLTNRTNEDGTTGAPALYANIPITGIKEDIKKDIDKKKEEPKETDSEQEEKEIDNDDSIVQTDDTTEEKLDEPIEAVEEEQTEITEEIEKTEEKNSDSANEKKDTSDKKKNSNKSSQGNKKKNSMNKEDKKVPVAESNEE